MLKAASVLLVLLTATAHAEVPQKYVGVSVDLSNGFAGKSEFGFAAQVAPLRYLELEGGMIRHDAGDHDAWLVTASVRAKAPIKHGAFFAGLGVVTGEHSVSNGCSSSGFIDFCGDENGTYVERHWDRAVWLRPEFGGEWAFSVVAFRFTAAPLYQMAKPDMESGCLECDDGEQGVVFTMGLHGRLPL